MRFYIFFLIISCILAYLSQTQGHYVFNNDGAEVYQRNHFYMLLMLLLFCFGYTFRWKVGTDFSGYYYGFDSYGALSLSESIGGRDWAFSFLSCLIYKIAPGNHQFYFFILSIITYVPVVLFFDKNSEDFDLVIFLYIAMLSCFWPYNGVRQSLAISICLLSLEFMNEKKYVRSCMLIAIAITFHATAFVFIPLSLFLRLRPWSRGMVSITSLLLLSVLFLDDLWGSIIRFLDGFGQVKFVNDYGNAVVSSGGVNILRIAVAIIPVLLSLISALKEPKMINEKNGVFHNMVVLSAIFMIAASRLTILARFSNYFNAGIPLVYNEFKNHVNDDSQMIYISGLCLCYLAYMLILLPVESNLVPYQSVFDFLH